MEWIKTVEKHQNVSKTQTQQPCNNFSLIAANSSMSGEEKGKHAYATWGRHIQENICSIKAKFLTDAHNHRGISLVHS
jgi:hypothetical protein